MDNHVLEKAMEGHRSQNNSLVSVAEFGPNECPASECLLIPQESFQLHCVEKINEIRHKHHVPRLTTSTKLMELARRRAIQLASYENHLTFPKGYQWGEVAFITKTTTHPKEYPCENIIHLFYNQRKFYDYKSGKPFIKGIIINSLNDMQINFSRN